MEEKTMNNTARLFHRAMALLVLSLYFIPMCIIAFFAVIIILLVPGYDLTSSKPIYKFIKPVRWADKILMESSKRKSKQQ